VKNTFTTQVEGLGVKIDKKQEQAFENYFNLLIQWNNKVNLTRIVDEKEVYEKHFLDSIAIVKSISLCKPYKIIDIGSGAGLPGIPLKIVFPELEVVLLDSLGKRVDFLEKVIKVLDLMHIKAINGRAEDLARDSEHRGSYDVAVSRAVSSLATLAEYSLPFLKVEGSFIAYKSDVTEELDNAKNALMVLGGRVSQVEKFNLPGTNISRTLVRVEKITETPDKYPRRAGIPEKRPL